MDRKLAHEYFTDSSRSIDLWRPIIDAAAFETRDHPLSTWVLPTDRSVYKKFEHFLPWGIGCVHASRLPKRSGLPMGIECSDGAVVRLHADGQSHCKHSASRTWLS